MKIAVCVQYDGSEFAGWQRQKHQSNTVQAHLEKALSHVADHPIQVFCAGRTDAGVHAVYQVCHFETDAHRNERSWVLGANSKLPLTIAIQWVKQVPDFFHARFSALSRTYRYVVQVSPFRPGVWHRHFTWVRTQLNVEAMQIAATNLLGERDFNAFKASGCQSKHSIRTLYCAHFIQRGDLLCFEIRANAFLQHMVRNIIGSLLEVGKGEQPPEWIKALLASKDRKLAGVTAPPNGLYFADCEYPSHFNLPAATHSQSILHWFDALSMANNNRAYCPPERVGDRTAFEEPEIHED